MSKETFYFSHDYNARTDVKIKGLIRKHGMTGYGIFWAIVEDLYNNANALQVDYDGIAYDLRTNSKIIESILNDFDLFSTENGCFGSKSVERRLDKRNEKSTKARESAFKRWSKDKQEDQRNASASKNDTKALRYEYEGNAIKESIIKDKIDKDIKSNHIVSFENFWNSYDKNIEREKCENLWNNFSECEKVGCIEYIPVYIKLKPYKRFRKNSFDYLNNKSWLNEISSTQDPGNIQERLAQPEKIFKPPTLNEVIKYFTEHGFDEILAKRAWEGYEVANWHDSQSKAIKNWKQKMIQVWFKEENRPKTLSIDRGQHPGQVMVTGKVEAKYRIDYGNNRPETSEKTD
jgi:hypothetical protein